MPDSDTQKPSLEQLLRRPDIWRGHSGAFDGARTLDSGYPALNRALPHRGWPCGCLVEVCQRYHAGEWQLFHPAIKTAIAASHAGHFALVNPPALPFIAGLEQLDIPTRQMLVVQTTTRQEFVASFTELSRCGACPLVFGWQPQARLNYTQLRKLQLSTAEQGGLYVIFRHLGAKDQSSPAGLRLSLHPGHDNLQVRIFKQRGRLQPSQVHLPIPAVWQKLPPHPHLQRRQSERQNTAYRPSDKGQLALFPELPARPHRNKQTQHD